MIRSPEILLETCLNDTEGKDASKQSFLTSEAKNIFNLQAQQMVLLAELLRNVYIPRLQVSAYKKEQATLEIGERTQEMHEAGN